MATPCLLTTTYHCVQESSSWPPSGQTRSCSLAQRRPRWLSPHLPQQSSPWEMLSPTPSNGPAAFVWADLSYRSERYLVSTFMKFQRLAAKIRGVVPEKVIVSPQNTVSVPQVHRGINYGTIHTSPVENTDRSNLIFSFKRGKPSDWTWILFWQTEINIVLT